MAERDVPEGRRSFVEPPHSPAAPLRTAESRLQVRETQVLATEENGLARLWQQHLKALEAGAALVLAHGPLHGFPVVNVGVELSWCQVSRGTSVAMVTAAASQCLARALKEAAVVLLEPVMHVEVWCMFFRFFLRPMFVNVFLLAGRFADVENLGFTYDCGGRQHELRKVFRSER